MILAAASLVVCLSACKKDDNKPADNSITLSGNWVISHFMEGEVDETSDFTGYVFSFSNNVVTATKSGSSVTGTYASGTDDSKKKLVLAFTSGDPLEELNEDWEVLESSSSLLKLQHVSGGDGSIDMLWFTRP